MKLKVGNALRKRLTRTLLIFLFILAAALVQTYTLWKYDGEKVDENALCYFAVGFFGGDFDPHWYGYGTLGMYLLYGVYMILALPLYLFNKISSLEMYALRLFTDGFFIQTARYLFAVLGMISVMVYAGIARQVKLSKSYIVFFVLISALSVDAVTYANYVRTDLLVAFFTALSIFFAVKSRQKIFLYFMAVAVAGAISAKISALPLVLLLVGYCGLRFRNKTVSLGHFFGIVGVFILCLYLFQPYFNIVDEILGNTIFGTAWRQDTGSAYFFGKLYHESIVDRAAAIAEILIRYCGWPVVIGFPLILFAKPYLRIVLPAVVALCLLIIPYAGSPEVLDYWFLPVFPIFRLLTLLGLAGLMSRFPQKASRSLAAVAGIVISVFILKPNVENYLRNLKKLESNAHIAQKDIEKHLLENEFLLLESYRAHSIPKFFSRDDMEMSKTISQAFIYERYRNEFLNRVFEKYVNDLYYEKIGVKKVQGVRRIEFIDVSNEDEVNSLNGKYYVTTPSAYETILRRSERGLNPSLKKRLEDLQAHYRFMISNPMIKRYDSGSGPVVEVYQITKTYQEYRAEIFSETIDLR